MAGFPFPHLTGRGRILSGVVFPSPQLARPRPQFCSSSQLARPQPQILDSPTGSAQLQLPNWFGRNPQLRPLAPTPNWLYRFWLATGLLFLVAPRLASDWHFGFWMVSGCDFFLVNCFVTFSL